MVAYLLNQILNQSVWFEDVLGGRDERDEEGNARRVRICVSSRRNTAKSRENYKICDRIYPFVLSLSANVLELSFRYMLNVHIMGALSNNKAQERSLFNSWLVVSGCSAFRKSQSFAAKSVAAPDPTR